MIIFISKKGCLILKSVMQPENPRVSELDLARMSIVSATQLASRETTWETRFHVDGTYYTVAGFAHRGRPFGLDGDLLLALQTIFFQAGCPDDSRFSMTPGQLLQMTSLSRSSKDHVRMREGLLRLASVRWEMTTRWTEEGAQKQRTNAAGVISDLWLDDTAGVEQMKGVQISEDSNIVIVFTATFASLIRQGLYQMLDGDLLHRLGTPSTRSLYRSLAAHRVKGETLRPTLKLSFPEWTSILGLPRDTQRSSRILTASHERLIEEGYLSHVEDTGRGQNRTLTYHFRAAEQSDQVQALMGNGVAGPVAASLSADHPERIYPALRCVEEKLDSGWKPRSLPAAIVDAVRNPGKWGYAAQEVSRAVPRKAPARKAVNAEEAPLDPKDTVRSLLRVRLSRSPSPAALSALESATPEQLAVLKTALTTHPSNMTLVESVLGCPV